MIDSIQKYAKIGLIHFMAYPSTIRGEGPVEETIRKIAIDDYFDGVKIVVNGYFTNCFFNWPLPFNG